MKKKEIFIKCVKSVGKFHKGFYRLHFIKDVIYSGYHYIETNEIALQSEYGDPLFTNLSRGIGKSFELSY
jgi:hypothetical protein